MNPLYYPTKFEIRQIVRAFQRLAAAYHLHACQNGGKGGGSMHRKKGNGGGNGK